MASLPDDVKERAIAIKAQNPDYGFKKILSLLKADMPNVVIPSSAVRNYLRENEDLVEKARVSITIPSITVTKPTKSAGIHGGELAQWPVAVIDIPNKGKGIVATRDIKPGELVLAEEPLMRLCKRLMGPEHLAEKLAPLTSEQRDAFYDLHRSGAQTEIPELDIILTNGFSMGDADDTGIFLVSSRINHTCLPNISNVWQEDIGKRHFHATKAIKKGDEIGFPYVNQLDTRDNRQRQLKASYGFECRCVACLREGDPLAASDQRRAELKAIDAELDTGLTVQPRKKLQLIEKALVLLDAEELVGPKYNFTSPAYQIHYSVLKDMQQAKIWAARAYEAGRISFGEGDERVVNYKKWMVKPGEMKMQSSDEMAFAIMAQMRLQGGRRGGNRLPFFPPGFPLSRF